MDQRYPKAEVVVDADLVRSLLEAQTPSLARESLAFVDEGWDNVTFRLGVARAVRVPRRSVGAELLLREQRWLPGFAPILPYAIPAPIHSGTPAAGYPWPWSIVPWIEGATADRESPEPTEAPKLGRALGSLHRVPPEDAPVNDVRTGPLESRRGDTGARIDALTASGGFAEAGLDAQRIRAAWLAAFDAPLPDRRVWLHGDLHERNVVVSGGRIVGLLDWGDMTAGHAPTDLACAWLLFDGMAARAALLDAYGASEGERARARGWAVHFGTAMMYSEEPRHLEIGQKILRRILD